MSGNHFERLVLRLLLVIISLLRSEGFLKHHSKAVQEAKDFIVDI